MNMNFYQALRNFNGEAIKRGPETLYISDMISNALSVTQPKNPQTDAIKQYDLALKIYNAREALDVNETDIVLLKSVMSQNELKYTALILGQVFKVLDGKEIEPALKPSKPMPPKVEAIVKEETKPDTVEVKDKKEEKKPE